MHKRINIEVCFDWHTGKDTVWAEDITRFECCECKRFVDHGDSCNVVINSAKRGKGELAEVWFCLDCL